MSKKARTEREAVRQLQIENGKAQSSSKNRILPKWLAWTGLVYAGLAANNIRLWRGAEPLVNELPGEAGWFRSELGETFYKVDNREAKDTPVVFVHAVGAGNSSHEWLQNFEAIAQHHPTYAYDLLGFGNSSRPNVRYTAKTYIRQLADFLENVVGRPAYLVASSISASYAVQVAARQPQLVKKLLLIHPTGLNLPSSPGGVQLLPRFTYDLLREPVLGRAIFSLVASRLSIRSVLENQLFFDKSRVTAEMVEQYYRAAHQPGSEHAPPSFFTGQLNAELGQTTGQLTQPVLIVCGQEAKFTTPQELRPLQANNPHIRLEEIPQARMLVQWEQAAAFNRLAQTFLQEVEPQANGWHAELSHPIPQPRNNHKTFPAVKPTAEPEQPVPPPPEKEITESAEPNPPPKRRFREAQG